MEKISGGSRRFRIFGRPIFPSSLEPPQASQQTHKSTNSLSISRPESVEVEAAPTPALRPEISVDYIYKPPRVKQHFANYNTPVQDLVPPYRGRDALPAPIQEQVDDAILTANSKVKKSANVIKKYSSGFPPNRKVLPKGTRDHGADGYWTEKMQNNVSSSPNCSLNLLCYRSGTEGYKLRRINTINRSQISDAATFLKALAEQPRLISTDTEFFQALRNQYFDHMCSFTRRTFFLKTLVSFRLLKFTPSSRPTVVPHNEVVMHELLYAFRNPTKVKSERDWIHWVFRLRRHGHRHALEFVEAWNWSRIAIAGSLPPLISTIVGIIWSFIWKDVQTAIMIAGFILTAGTLMLALLAVISGLESSTDNSFEEKPLNESTPLFLFHD